MADKKKPDPQVESDEASMDDKSINDLLKEYADDVKDNDIDDFLQDAPDDDEDDDSDAFENDDELMEEAPAKRSGGFLSLLLVLLLCGGAGAGAWWYLNRDDGMTSVIGGFQGEPLVQETFEVSAPSDPLVPDTTPVLPTFNEPAPVAQTIDIPMPSDTTATPSTALVDVLSEDVPTPPQPEQAAAAPIESAPSATAPAVTAPVAEAPAAQAVDEWLSASDSSVPADVTVTVDEALPPVVETPVAEIKAKPVKIDPNQKAAPVKADKTATPAPSASGSASYAPARQASPDDSALPPPYLAIQSRKGSGATTVAAPVMSAEPTIYTRGSTAHTEPSTTRAEGIYRDMVARGGGEIVTNETVVTAPGVTVVEDSVEYLAPAPAASASVHTSHSVHGQLAISGARSLPEGREAAVPVSRAPAPAVNMPQGGETVTVIDEMVVTVPKSAPVSAPVSAPTSTNPQAAAFLQQAQAAEASGQYDQAVTLYQRALEADAVYGDGRSIDRGMVYDRIGAIRARR